MAETVSEIGAPAMERACDFEPPSAEDWLIKGLIPKEGVGTLFLVSAEEAQLEVDAQARGGHELLQARANRILRAP